MHSDTVASPPQIDATFGRTGPMPRVHIDDGVSLYCQDLGDGPPVILVHGGCMSHRVWESQVYALLEAGYRVVTFDLRGHGWSDKPASPYLAETFADDIAALADALGIDEFALLGWSLGATVVTTFAGKYADRLTVLVLVSSSIFDAIALSDDDQEGRKLPLEMMIANQRRNRPRGMERFVSGMFGPDPDEWVVRWLWTIGMETPMRVAIEILKIYADPDVDALRRALADLDIPTAVFHGRHDRGATLADAESVATDVCSDGVVILFEDSGHVPFLEESTRFDEELVAVLDA